MAAEGQSDKIASDMELCMKQRCVTEFLYAEKIAPTDIHWCLLNIYGDQTVDVSTARQWVVRFSSGNNDMKGKHTQMSHHKIKSISISSSTDYSQRTVYRTEYQLQCIGSDGGNIGMSWSLHQVGPTNVHTGIERILCVSSSGAIESIRGWRWQFLGLHHYQWWDVVSPPWARVKTAVHSVAVCEFTIKEVQEPVLSR